MLLKHYLDEGVSKAELSMLEPDDTPMTVRTAIAPVNQVRDEISGEEATGYDADPRSCIDWFEAFGMDEGKSGNAIIMAQAYDIGIDDLETPVRSGLTVGRPGRFAAMSYRQIGIPRPTSA